MVLGFSMWKNLPASAGDVCCSLGLEDPWLEIQPTPVGFLPGRSHRQRRAWWAIVHGVTKSWTWPGHGLATKQQQDRFEGCSEVKMKRNGNSLSIGVEEDKCPKVFEVSDQCAGPDGWWYPTFKQAKKSEGRNHELGDAEFCHVTETSIWRYWIASENISARNKKWIITNTRQLKPAETDFCNTFGVFLTPPHSEEVQYFLYIPFWIFSDIICPSSCGIQHSSPLPIIGLATVSCFYFIKSLCIQLVLKYQEVSFDKVI